MRRDNEFEDDTTSEPAKRTDTGPLAEFGDNPDIKRRSFPPPKYLRGREIDIWYGLVDIAPLGHWDDLDIAVMANYCKASAELEKLTRKLSREAVVIPTAAGTSTKVNPHYRASAQLVSMVRRLSLRLDLQHLKSARIRSDEGKVDKTTSQLHEQAMNDDANPRFGLFGSRIAQPAT